MQEKGWLLELSKSSIKSLERLEDKFSNRILDHIEKLGECENPLQHRDVRSLEGKLKGYYRLRVGEYRIIFELDTQRRRIGILAVVPRGKGY
ncbi:MAG: type II toxin-antitoxin system RelE/ParE family toxin [Candidatus Aminicenantes bacterium]|nr:type II toxin-antitoxin system RelE/ParE family toxin [Candidatus Aminicenantes bacterium]MBM3305154.1 type II toxin-antitoxin system RelE/ParE family toxin [Candidatus Aminicenantes bacterium]